MGLCTLRYVRHSGYGEIECRDPEEALALACTMIDQDDGQPKEIVGAMGEILYTEEQIVDHRECENLPEDDALIYEP
jgi:hypothetical protein